MSSKHIQTEAFVSSGFLFGTHCSRLMHVHLTNTGWYTAPFRSSCSSMGNNNSLSAILFLNLSAKGHNHFSPFRAITSNTRGCPLPEKNLRSKICLPGRGVRPQSLVHLPRVDHLFPNLEPLLDFLVLDKFRVFEGVEITYSGSRERGWKVPSGQRGSTDLLRT